MKKNLETLCIHGGWKPTKGEPQQLPIYQSTTFKYDTSEQMARMYNVSETGTYVYSVEDDSAAAEAGLKSGDRIISIDGQEITSNEDVRNLVSSSKVGDELNFVIQRGLSEETLTVTVGEYVPDAMPAVSE